MMHHNSMMFWHPLLAITSIPMPSTIIVPVAEFKDSFQEARLLSDLGRAVAEVGLPAFLRTDFFSGKHQWTKTCYLDSVDTVKSHVKKLAEESFFHGLRINAFVVREFLQLETVFCASLWNDMPVAKERRYFVRNGEVSCHHPYWDAAVFQEMAGFSNIIDFKDGESNFLPPGWRELLEIINLETESEIEHLSALAETAGQALGGEWSVDFAALKDGGWVLIDCALARDSWHPPGGRGSSGITCPLEQTE